MERKNFGRPNNKEGPLSSVKPRSAEPSSPATARPWSPGSSGGSQTAVSEAPKKTQAKLTHAEICERAKAIWEAGGRVPGRDKENWLEAERQLKAERGLS